MKKTLLLITLIALLIGCGAATPPKELVDARDALTEANNGPAARHNPAKLHIAEQALKQAEWSFEDDGDTERTRTLSYVALRQAQLANAEARAIIASDRSEQAQETAQKRTIGELQKTREQLAKERQQLAAEKQARIAAEQRAKEAIERLKESLARIGKVQEEKRGTVITLSGSVLFKSGESTLMESAQDKIEEVAKAIIASNRKVVVEGHTDSRGKADFNQQLSEARAQAVLGYLVRKGVPPEDIRAVGVGASRPIADNKTAEGRANNRRVEIILGEEKEAI
ncbi:MAG: OmpA family protein [Myxococcales bacterium]|nr:MAG: OmpA family protein [Myxococcales bacterium]